MATVTTSAQVAHLLRRTSFGPLPGQVDKLTRLGIQGAINHVLVGVPLPVVTPDLTDDSSDEPAEAQAADDLARDAALPRRRMVHRPGPVSNGALALAGWHVDWDLGRVPDNESNGLDHGAGSFVMLMGPVNPGLYGAYPDLSTLDGDDNLVATVHMNDYYATLAEGWFGVPAHDVLSGGTPLTGLFTS